MRTAIYARLSEDRAGEHENVAIQEAECREYAEQLGWEIVEVFSDNDLSASRYSKKPRPGYQALLAAVRAGQVEAVLVTEMPRLYRRMEELLELIDLAEQTPLRRVETTDGTGYDLSTGQGVHAAHTAVSTAWLESRRLSDRARRKKKAQAREGRYSGGPHAYGYTWTPVLKDRGGKVLEPGRLEVNEQEATVIREAVAKLLAGQSLRGVAHALNDAGHRTSTGAYWRPSNLKRVLTSHRIIGVRTHNGAEYPGQWPAILDRETWERVGLLLNTEARFKGAAKKAGRSYLLTGMIVCGYCGDHPMVGYSSADPRSKLSRRRYYCKSIDDRGVRVGCGKVSRLAEPVEALVSEAVLQVLDSERMTEVLTVAATTEEMAGLVVAYQERKLKLEDLVADYASGLLNREQLAQAKAIVEEAMEDLRRRMAKLQSGQALASVPPGQSFREAWESADLDWRRSLVALVLDRVVLHPGRPGNHRWRPSVDDPREWCFDPTKVELRWKV
jgi:DNA invertase Pin-like site-specific DNA recombinase